jgi:hypothetical protein
MPDNRGFYGFFNEKSHKNLQAQPAPGIACQAPCSLRLPLLRPPRFFKGFKKNFRPYTMAL